MNHVTTMDKVKLLFGPMRIPFLVLAPACVFLGIGVAAWQLNGSLDVWQVVLVFIGGVCAHISVNALNEYSDFKTGLDEHTQRTPFSGGSGVLQAHPEMSGSALATGLVAAGITAVIGVYFLFLRGWGLLPIGLLGLVVVLLYTPWLNRNPWLCLIAPGLGFGTAMVLGTEFALTGGYTWGGVIASLVPFFLVNNLLLLNQFPDAEADSGVGRRHLVIVAGKKVSAVVYSCFVAATYVALLVGVAFHVLPVWSLLGLASLALAVPLVRGVLSYADGMPKLMSFLGVNVLVILLTPVLVGVGLLLA